MEQVAQTAPSSRIMRILLKPAVEFDSRKLILWVYLPNAAPYGVSPRGLFFVALHQLVELGTYKSAPPIIFQIIGPLAGLGLSGG